MLESIRLLSDFETSQGKLLQIILAGQRQLIGTLMKPGMLQLTQRISVTNFLDPLDSEEVTHYISHRLGVAGYQGKPLFTTEALQLVAEESGGTPRNINNICFGALSTAFGLKQKRIDRKIIEEVAAEQSVRSLTKRMQVSSGPTTQPASLSGVDVKNRSAPRPTWHRVFRPGWFSKHARGTVCLLTVLLALTSGVAISKRPELAIQAFSESKADSTSAARVLEVASPAQHAFHVIIPQATPNALPTPFLRIRLRLSSQDKR